MIEFCKCGASTSVRSCYSTSTGHGYRIRCNAGHPGPWAVTINGATRVWNQLQKSPLTLEQADQAMGIGFTVKEAIRLYENAHVR